MHDNLPFNDYSLAELESAALSATLIAADILKDGFYSHLKVTQKTNIHDVVTQFDEKAEKAIKHSLLSAFPKHAFVGEETGICGDIQSQITWVVDPIDGTWNFARQIPSFAISIAAVFQGKPYVSICYDPISTEMFIAKRGFGATMNGRKIVVSNTKDMASCGISLGTTVGIDAIHQIALIRRSGSSVLDLCYVAKGALEGFVEWRLNSWDFAAAMLIVEEAGGMITTVEGAPIIIDYKEKSSIVASNTIVHKDLIKWISTAKK